MAYTRYNIAGKEATGIVSFDGQEFRVHRGIGHVGEWCTLGAGSAHIESLTGHVAIGHNRYSTSGKSNAFLEIQPFSSELAFGGFVLAHNETSPMRPVCDRLLLKLAAFSNPHSQKS